jgi:hypothetical protein
MTSIGTLFAFVVVCAAVMMLRIKRPDAKRPFRVPGGHVFPVLGVLSCLYLMLSLSVVTWVRFLVWLDLGMVIYWFYGRTHSPLADAQESARRTGQQSLANFRRGGRGPGRVQRLLHDAAGVPDRMGRHQREHGQVARDPRHAGAGRRRRDQVLAIGIAILIAGIVLTKVSGEGRKQAA